MAPVLAERETIIRRILFSLYVRPAVKIFPVSAMIERLPSPPSSFSPSRLFIASWPLNANQRDARVGGVGRLRFVEGDRRRRDRESLRI
ncbi:hypothetical protein PUN28_002029 [Cardiocondyla obscurior]|uniref:Uncharacterized protein n=1 Tax=Cardiocondyla obscurior TaxID=286306 RepID=A0AAW2GS75_9HYME